jgi:hypothetical protein
MRGRQEALLAVIAIITVVALAPLPAAAQAATGSISGIVYVDANGNGALDSGEDGAPAVKLQLAGGNPVTIREVESDALTAIGAYSFSGVAPGTYTVTVLNSASFAGLGVTTLPVTVDLAVNEGTVTGIDFPVSPALSVSGFVYDDRDLDGVRGLSDPLYPGALVQIKKDVDGDLIYEQLLGAATTNAQGFYAIPGLLPRQQVLVAVQLSGGISGGSQLVTLPAYEDAIGGSCTVEFGVEPVLQSPYATLFGVLWNDLDGDERLDASDPVETVFANARIMLYRDLNGNRLIDLAERPGFEIVTDSQGAYKFLSLESGRYILDPNLGTLPGNFAYSTHPSALAFELKPGQIKRLDVAYYDPQIVAPLRVADWKKELTQSGQPNYRPDQLTAFISAVEDTSAYFATGAVKDAILLPARGDEAQARKEYAAQLLNIAAKRLLLPTRVNLPALTPNVTVEAVTAEIENQLQIPLLPAQEYRRLRDLAESLNKGKGLGYGLEATLSLAKATHKGNDVTGKLRPAGDNVDLVVAEPPQPIYLLGWNTGTLTQQPLELQLRLRVKRFENGGVIDVKLVQPDGSTRLIGTAVPTIWNKDINAIFTFDVPHGSAWTSTDVNNVKLHLYVRDPANDGGSLEHARVDSAELIYKY